MLGTLFVLLLSCFGSRWWFVLVPTRYDILIPAFWAELCESVWAFPSQMIFSFRLACSWCFFSKPHLGSRSFSFPLGSSFPLYQFGNPWILIFCGFRCKTRAVIAVSDTVTLCMCTKQKHAKHIALTYGYSGWNRTWQVYRHNRTSGCQSLGCRFRDKDWLFK